MRITIEVVPSPGSAWTTLRYFVDSLPRGALLLPADEADALLWMAQPQGPPPDVGSLITLEVVRP